MKRLDSEASGIVYPQQLICVRNYAQKQGFTGPRTDNVTTLMEFNTRKHSHRP